MKKSIRFITTISIFAAFSTVLFYIGGIAIIPFAPHLKIDLSVIPSLTASIIVGPIGGVWVELIKNVLHLLRTDTFGIGEIASFVVGAGLTASFGYMFRKCVKKFSLTKTLVLSIFLSLIVTEICGVIINLIVYPIYMKLLGVSIESFGVMVSYIGSVVLLNSLKFLITIVVGVPIGIRLNRMKVYNCSE